MSKGDLFEILKIEMVLPKMTGKEIFRIEFKINPGHQIFKGHFPGQPVVPGVMMVEIIKQCTERITRTGLILKTASNIKFLSVMVPEGDDFLESEISLIHQDNGDYKVHSILTDKNNIYLKFDGIFSKK